jgi:hypothetical protein
MESGENPELGDGGGGKGREGMEGGKGREGMEGGKGREGMERG